MQTLQEQLTAHREKSNAKRDPALVAALGRSVDELRASGIAERVVSVGDRAPLFARPDLNGDTVRLHALLRRGPVIVSFFRGRW